jgi:hypothetical protein
MFSSSTITVAPGMERSDDNNVNDAARTPRRKPTKTPSQTR